MKGITIKRKIFLYVCTSTVLSVALICLVIYIFFFQTLKNNEINYMLQSSEITKQNIEFTLKLVNNTGSLLRANEDLLYLLKTSPDNKDPNYAESKRKINIDLQNIVKVQKYIKSIYVITANGNLILSKSNFLTDGTIDLSIKENEIKRKYGSLSGKDFLDKDYLIDSYPAEYSSLSDSYIVSYVKPVFDSSSGNTLGTIIIDLNYDYLTDIFSTSSVQNNEKILVLNQKGEKIFNYPYNIAFQEIIKSTPEVLDLDKVMLYKNILGQNSIVMLDTIYLSNWKIIRFIPTERIYKQANIVKTIAIFMSVIFIILSLSISVILSFTLTRPILELNKKIKLVEKGDLSVNVEVKSDDELGQLSLSFNNMVMRLKDLIREIVEEQKKKSDMEFQLLQTQINPHFLYNTLDSIKWLAVIQNVNNISEMTTSLINLLKYNISRSHSSVTLADEIENIKSYTVVQQYRYGDMFTVNYNIDEKALDCTVLRLILQPIVENAIFHGFENFENNGIIEINASINDKLLVLSVADNGVGINPEDLDNILNRKESNKKFTGIGIKNIDERIKLYFGNEYGISFSSKLGAGTVVTITLPAVMKDNS